jgi:glycosyltransferase involved in cell wall biosynthesis
MEESVIPRMKVLNVVHLLDAVTGGGTAERTFQLSRFFAKSGVACSVLTMDIGISRERLNRLQGVAVIAIPAISRRFPLPLINPFRLVSLVRQADVIHLMNHWTALNVFVYWTCRALGRPYAVCPAGALQIYGRTVFLKKAYNWIVGRRLIRNADACIAITQAETRDFLDHGVDTRRIHIIPNGIDPEDFSEDISPDELTDFRKRHGLGNQPVILFMGRLNPIKGPDLLLEAFISISKIFPTHRLVFVGPDNGLYQSLKKTVDAAHLEERIHFLGYLAGRGKACAYRMADVLVIPSRQEAMSIVVLEAGICGTPVLATDRCGLGDLAAEGVVRLVEPTPEAISKGLLELLRHPAEMRETGVRLKQSVFENYLWQTQAQHHLRVFQEMATSGR